MFKTIALSGAEQEVKFSAKHQFFHFHNLGGGEVLASLQPGVTRSKDGVLIVPSGGKGRLEVGSAADTVYVTGTGEIQIAGTGNAFSPFSSGVKGGGKVTSDNGAVSAVGTVDYPLVGLNLYGKSVQDGVPTPENPIGIVSIGKTGLEITASGKNLFDFNQIASKTSNGVTITNNNDGTFTFNGAKTDITKTFSTSYSLTHEESVQLFSAGTYTISGVPKEYGGALYGYISLYYNGTNTYNFLSTRSTVTNTITADMLTDDFYVTFGFFSLANEDVPSATVYLQVEKSADATSFEAYKGNTAFVSSGMPLCSIGDVRDELIYNADGTGKIVKRVKKSLQLLSNYSWAMSANPTRFGFPAGTTGADVSNGYAVALSEHFSDCRVHKSWIDIVTDDFESLDEFKAFLDANEVYVYYPLATPEEIEFSAEEMAELMQLQTFDDVTNIYNDEGAKMTVKVTTNPLLSEYVKPIIDGITARYETRIAALEAAVTNN